MGYFASPAGRPGEQSSPARNSMDNVKAASCQGQGAPPRRAPLTAWAYGYRNRQEKNKTIQEIVAHKAT